MIKSYSMLFSLNWIKLYLTPVENQVLIDIINKRFIYSCFEVESIEPVEKSWEGLIVGKLIECEKVENSKKLNRCVVFDGKENLDVICGGEDLVSGENYCFAPVGSTINGMNICSRKIQGLPSNGMLCSYEEIKVNCTGIMAKLDPNMIPGTPMENIYSFNIFDDYLMDIKITPNRPDCMSVEGIAREIAACSNGLVSLLTNDFKVHQILKVENVIKPSCRLNVEDCPYFYTCTVELENDYTPFWLKILLSHRAIKSRNLPVDLSNFLMISTGYPSHIYGNISSKNNYSLEYTGTEENFSGVDGKQYKLPKGTMVMKIDNEIASVLGMMGSQQFAYDQPNCFGLEIALFNQDKIRNYSKLCKISSEAAIRFSKFLDHGFLRIYHQFISLLQKPYHHSLSKDLQAIQNNKLSISELQNSIDGNNNPTHSKEPIFISVGDLHKVTGESIDINTQINILKNLGFKAEFTQKHLNTNDLNTVSGILVNIPTWRAYDIHDKYDVIEEIYRFSGLYNGNIEEKNDNLLYKSYQEDGKEFGNFQTSANVKSLLTFLGYSEVICYPFISTKNLTHYYGENSEQYVNLEDKNLYENILVQEYWDKLLEQKDYLLSKGFKNTNLFTMGKTYSKKPCIQSPWDVELGYNRSLDPLHTEQGYSCNTMVNSDELKPYIEKNSIFAIFNDSNINQQALFVHVKKQITNILLNIGIDKKSIYFHRDIYKDILHPNKTVAIYLDTIKVGYIGILDSHLSINSSTVLWSINEMDYVLSKKDYIRENSNIVTNWDHIDISFFVNKNQGININNIKSSLFTKFPQIEQIDILDHYLHVQDKNEENSGKESYTMAIWWKYNGTAAPEEFLRSIAEFLNKEDTITLRS